MSLYMEISQGTFRELSTEEVENVNGALAVPPVVYAIPPLGIAAFWASAAYYGYQAGFNAAQAYF